MPDDNAAEDSKPDLDEWDLELAQSEEFWRMIAERRKGKGISWEEVKKELDLE